MGSNGLRRVPSLEEAFWKRVERRDENECWPWQGALTSGGYGQMGHGRRGEDKKYVAHRLAYELLVGPIPDGLVIDHLCRNRACVNPTHMEPVTSGENVLRGVGWGGTHSRKAHCPLGHPLEGDNLSQYHLWMGQRKCLTCHANRERKRRKRLKEAQWTG